MGLSKIFDILYFKSFLNKIAVFGPLTAAPYKLNVCISKTEPVISDWEKKQIFTLLHTIYAISKFNYLLTKLVNGMKLNEEWRYRFIQL